MLGAIDLGGTKIEACIFDMQLNRLECQRVATPQDSYDSLLDALVQQCEWLQSISMEPKISIGIGMPGLVDPLTGFSITSNLPAMGRTMKADLARRLSRPIAVENDCKCFTLSEAQGGAGEGHEVVFGLILGTGVGGGVCRQGELMLHHNALSGEVGHIALPSNWVQAWRQPLLKCGCGRTGCYETYLSGPGMSRLCENLTGKSAPPNEIVQGRGSNGAQQASVYQAWFELLCELIRTLQLGIDPGCVVFGGGLSRIPNLAEQVADAFPRYQLSGIRAPHFSSARFGDSSGVRGAAILAKRLYSF